MKEELKQKELWTQKEVADYFRVVPATIKNWREQGLLSYWQAPGSSRVLFVKDDVIKFRDDNIRNQKGGESKAQPKPRKERPDLSATKNRKWKV